jgi:UDP-2,3-diacylglucosamine hydrolase
MSLTFDIPHQADLVIASDIHIREANDERSLALQQLIRACTQNEVGTFVLNGDIFDFFFGGTDYFRQKHHDLFAALETLAKSGCEVIVIEGNHEFDLTKLKTTSIQYVDSYGLLIKTRQGLQVKIVHGDLMHHDPAYQIFRRVVRSRALSLVAASISQRLLDLATLWFASLSRKKDRYRTLHHESILSNALNILNESSANHMVFGHFHHPYEHKVDDERMIYSVDSWDKPSCLVFTDNHVKRVFASA